MSDPTGYAVSYNFSGFQASNPSTPLPAPPLDAELANIAASVATLVSSIKNVRRSDDALNNGIVTFDALSPALQLMLDPTDATLVANAVAAAQASATAAAGSNTSAAGHDTAAAASAVAAAASASGVNLTLYLAKANNLAGLGSNTTALANIGAADVAGNTATGRWAPFSVDCEDFNTAVQNGWYSGSVTSENVPVSGQVYLLEVSAFSALWVAQKAWIFNQSNGGLTSAVTPYRRYGYDGGGFIVWTPWETAVSVAVGSSIMVNGTVAPAGYLKENGALISRATYPALTAYALASGNIVSEATWSGGNSGSFSTGDLATTIRLPDSRGYFVRGWADDGSIDSGRAIGLAQADAFKSHSHAYNATNTSNQAMQGGSTNNVNKDATTSTTGSTGGTETRPINVPKLICIKY